MKGGSTLTFYLNTVYMSFYYYIDTAQAQEPIQGSSYVTVKMIDHAVPADFGSTTSHSPLADRSAARHATWMSSWELRTELHAGYYWGTMNEIREGYTGWYTTETGEVKHADVISGNDLKTAADSSGALYSPYTIEFYALKNFGAMYISKSVYSINGELVTGEIGEIEVGDRIVYKIVLANTGNVLLNSSNKSIKDMLGDTELLLYRDPECDPDSSQRYYFTDIRAGDSETMYAAYTVTADDIGTALTNTVTATSDTLSATDTCTIEVEPEKDYSVTIAPADILAYTGGRGYGSVVGGDGQLHDSVEGLPEPGYHISLSEDTIEWLAEQVGSIKPQDLSEYLAFTYDDGIVTRRWELEYMGIYESDAETGDPLRYVYSLNSTGDAPAVRLQYWDGSSYVFDDDIDMSETAVNASYTMSLYPGSLDQGLVKAVLTVGDESIEAKALSGTGTLTVLSTVNKDGNTTDIGGDAGAVDGGSVTAVGDAAYYVNDTEVPITDPERVKLLVDEVSNSSEYVEAMAETPWRPSWANMAWTAPAARRSTSI